MKARNDRNMTQFLVLWLVCLAACQCLERKAARSLSKRQASTFRFLSSSDLFTAPVSRPGALVSGKVSTNYDTGTIWTIVFPTNNFAINMQTGQLILINYLQNCAQYTVTVRASNPSRGTIQNDVKVQTGGTCTSGTIGTAGAPVFAQSSGYTLSTGLNNANAFVGTVTATGTGTLIHTLVSPYFNINPLNGQIFMIGCPPTSPTTVSVTATNSAGQTTAVPVTIYTSACTASSPSFTQTAYAFTAATCSAGAYIGQVTATTTSGATVSYSIFGSSPSFAISPGTGVIYASSALYAGTVQMIYVTATDSQGRSKTMPLTIAVPPTCAGAATTTSATTAAPVTLQPVLGK